MTDLCGSVLGLAIQINNSSHSQGFQEVGCTLLRLHRQSPTDLRIAKTFASDRPLISVPIATVVAVAATAIKLKAQKRDAEAIYWVAISITRGRICVSIVRAIVLI